VHLLTDLLITFHVLKGACGRGPALVGLLFASAFPVGVAAAMLHHACPGGITGILLLVVQGVWRGLH
jgi:hypothetical protein